MECTGRLSESYFGGLAELESKLSRAEKENEEARLDPLKAPSNSKIIHFTLLAGASLCRRLPCSSYSRLITRLPLREIISTYYMALSSMTTSNKFGTNHFHIYSFKRILSTQKILYGFSRAPTEEIYFQELIISFWVTAAQIKPGPEFPHGWIWKWTDLKLQSRHVSHCATLSSFSTESLFLSFES